MTAIEYAEARDKHAVSVFEKIFGHPPTFDQWQWINGYIQALEDLGWQPVQAGERRE